MLPNLGPLRRAARFDGVYPIQVDMSDMTPEAVARVKSYIEEHRTETGPYDFVVFGVRGDLNAFREAGATWCLAGPSQTGESQAETLDWVRAGPPGATTARGAVDR
jgi:hypothetical protein